MAVNSIICANNPVVIARFIRAIHELKVFWNVDHPHKAGDDDKESATAVTRKMLRSEALTLISETRANRASLCREDLELNGFESSDGSYLGLIMDSTQYEFRTAKNELIALAVFIITGKEVLVSDDTEIATLPCPCCGAYTLDELHDPKEGTGYDVCGLCGWEDVGLVDPNKPDGCNGGSMNEYRERLAKNITETDRLRWCRKLSWPL